MVVLLHVFRHRSSLLLCVVLLCALSFHALSPSGVAVAQSPQDTFALRQWARSATATSQFGSSAWSAMQAAGQPDTLSCGDYATAWASSFPTGQDALTLLYDVPVIPTEVNIYQTYNPGAITGVELLLADGSGAVSVPNSADPGTECPGAWSIPIPDGAALVNGVVIYLDQSVTGVWNEIDAVELVGVAQVGQDVSLWASYALATSAYGQPSWSPLQATSAPDSLECLDSSSAWASSDMQGQDTLTVFFPLPLIASQLTIVQSFNPGAIIGVDLILPDYSSVPIPDSADPGTDCPGSFVLAVTETSPVIGAAIHLDQTLTEGWNEIDAVQISGVIPTLDDRVVRQWASSATATSEYGTESWSATQATGQPDSLVCGDQVTAWASADSTGQETLTLRYDTPVFPAAVNIYQTFNPGAITGIELLMADGSGSITLPNSADPGTPCPGVWSFAASGVESPVNGVVLYLDQTITGSWNEIDAVELVGLPTP